MFALRGVPVLRVVRASSSSSSSSSSKPANRKERRKMEREMTTTTLNTVEKSEMNLSSENDEKEEETTMESSNNNNNNNNNVNFKLQKPKKRKVNKETYNDVVEKRRRESREEKARTMNEASTSSSSLVIPSRDDVVASCTSTSTLILMLGLGARFVVPKLAEMNPLTLGLIKDGVDWKHACLASALAVGVTAGRVAFMSASEDFRKETNDSNKQVLTNLEFPDVLFCAAYPALAEEMLFRGALMPALGGGAVGVLVAGTVFGALHISGERKVSFAVWAATVGILYGATCEYLADGDLFVPICGHALANIYSALLWRASESERGFEYK
jgi:membrane protease YdiL (CAAX protease family)